MSCSATTSGPPTEPDEAGVGRYPTEEEWCSTARAWRRAREAGDWIGMQWLLGIADRAGVLVEPEGVDCGE